MLTWAKALMEAESDDQPSSFNREVHSNGPGASEQVLRQMAYIRTTQRPMIDEKSPLEISYALGWFRHMLPSSWLGSIGPNFGLFAEPPLINASGCPRLTIAHWGGFNGFLTAFYTFPSTKSAVVVMANCSPGRGDPTDLVAQHLVQSLFDMQPRVDFQQAAHEAASTAKLMWPALVEELVTQRVQNTKHRPLQDCVCIYQSTDYKVTIDIYELPKAKVGKGPNPELLGFKINSLPRQAAKLRHYHYDSWTFIPDSRDDAVRKGMEGFLQLSLLIMNFVVSDSNELQWLEWDLQGGKFEGPAPGWVLRYPLSGSSALLSTLLNGLALHVSMRYLELDEGWFKLT